MPLWKNGIGCVNFCKQTVDLEKILRTFPDDEPMNKAVAACHGLRILRQEPQERPGFIYLIGH